MDLIIFPNEDGISIVYPSGDVDLETTIRYSVPEGVPYRIITEADLPEDKSQRNLWTADFTNPDGISPGRGE